MSYFKAKMHPIRFRLGLRPIPHHWGSLQRLKSLAGFKGPTSKGKGGKGRGGEGRKREENGRGGKERWREGREREKGKGKREGKG